MTTLTTIPIQLVDPGPNDRTTFNERHLADLAASIARDGIAQPPTVRPMPNGRFEIVCGERRIRAMRLLGWEDAPVIVRPMSDIEASAIMLAENLARVDLDPVSEGQAYARRIEQFAMTETEVAAMAAVPLGRVSNRVRCWRRLSDAAKQDYAAGLLNHQLAIDLCRVDPDRQHSLLALLRRETFTARQWADLIARVLEAQREDSTSGLFDPVEFELTAESYVSEVKGKRVATRSDTRDLIQRLAIAAVDVDPALAEEARTWLLTTH